VLRREQRFELPDVRVVGGAGLRQVDGEAGDVLAIRCRVLGE
jgi:hypothetical protein